MSISYNTLVYIFSILITCTLIFSVMMHYDTAFRFDADLDPSAKNYADPDP